MSKHWPSFLQTDINRLAHIRAHHAPPAGVSGTIWHLHPQAAHSSTVAVVGTGEGLSHTLPQLPQGSEGRGAFDDACLHPWLSSDSLQAGFGAKPPQIQLFLVCLFIPFQALCVTTCYHNREHLDVSRKGNK